MGEIDAVLKYVLLDAGVQGETAGISIGVIADGIVWRGVITSRSTWTGSTSHDIDDQNAPTDEPGHFIHLAEGERFQDGTWQDAVAVRIRADTVSAWW